MENVYLLFIVEFEPRLGLCRYLIQRSELSSSKAEMVRVHADY
jgi:hypothetical protein